MRVGIIGLANSGKSTVFNALTGQNVSTPIYSAVEAETNVGVVKVPDERVRSLSEIYRPKKVTFATVEYIDYLGITRGDSQQNRKVLEMIKDVDALLHVIRAFDDDSVVHPLGKLDPERDAETVLLELLLSDLELVEKRLQRMDEGRKRGRKENEKEKRLLLRCREILEKELPLSSADFSDDETAEMRHLQFISRKPAVLVLNIHEDSLGDADEDPLKSLSAELKASSGSSVVSMSGKIEMEIAQLSSGEAEEFLSELGITEPAMYRLIRLCYEDLGLISFLTVGDDEVRAWTIRDGTTAQKAAGKIHTDIERGFIRAEVVSYQDFSDSGSMTAARDKGLVRLEGKTYRVQDGDIINFRFNV